MALQNIIRPIPLLSLILYGIWLNIYQEKPIDNILTLDKKNRFEQKQIIRDQLDTHSIESSGLPDIQPQFSEEQNSNVNFTQEIVPDKGAKKEKPNTQVLKNLKKLNTK